MTTLRLALVATALLVAACPTRIPRPDLSTLTSAQAVARVRAAAAKRERMVGTVKAKLPGLEGVVMSADLDVALQPPAMLSVAVRSFFEQPQQVLVTDGEIVTLYDATSGAPVFKRGPVDERAVSRVLPIPLMPAEVIAVFLARPEGTRGRLVSVDDKAGTYDVWLEGAGVAPCQLTVRGSDDGIVRWQHFRKDGRPSLDVRYADLRAVGDAVLPFRWSARVMDTGQALDFVATDVTFNGPALPIESFRLDPPANMPLGPL